MTIKAKLEKAVDKAFAKIDSLMIEALLSNREVVGFSFSSGEIQSSGSSVITKVFIESKKIWSKEGSTVKTFAYMKFISGIDTYDTLIANSTKYRIVSVITDGYLVTLELSNA